MAKRKPPEDFEPPRLQLGKFKQLVDHMHEVVGALDLDGHIAGEITCENITITLGSVLVGKFQCRREVLESCVRSLAGQTITYSVLNQLFSRIASCPERLAQDKPVFINDFFVPPESWHLLRIVQAREVQERDGRHVQVNTQVAWGHLWGLRINRLLAITDLGVLRMLSDLVPHGRGQKLTADWEEMTQMHMWAELLNSGSGIVFRRFYVNDQIDQLNAKVRRLRQQMCPRRYNWPCSRCPAGYDVCPAACRSESITPLPEPNHVVVRQSPQDRGTGSDDLDEPSP